MPNFNRVDVRDLENFDITPPASPQTVVFFAIRNESSLKRFPSVIFQIFSNLKTVKLEWCGIQAISQADFLLATNMESLDLGFNRLKLIRNSTFIHLPQLIELDLNSNEINEIEGDAFKGLDRILGLYLSFNRITIIRHNTIVHLTAVKILTLRGNLIETIESGALAKLPNLETIDLQKNYLKKLPLNLCQQSPLLQSLNMKRNQVLHLGDIFTTCKNLQVITLEENPLDDIQLLKFYHLNKLRVLHLDSTGYKYPLTDFQPNIVNNAPLQILSLENNSLSDANIFQRFSIFRNLIIVYLGRNEFTHFIHNQTSQIQTLLPDLRKINLYPSENLTERIIDDQFETPDYLKVLVEVD